MKLKQQILSGQILIDWFTSNIFDNSLGRRRGPEGFKWKLRLACWNGTYMSKIRIEWTFCHHDQWRYYLFSGVEASQRMFDFKVEKKEHCSCQLYPDPARAGLVTISRLQYEIKFWGIRCGYRRLRERSLRTHYPPGFKKKKILTKL